MQGGEEGRERPRPGAIYEEEKKNTKHNTIKVILWMGAASLLWAVTLQPELNLFQAPSAAVCRSDFARRLRLVFPRRLRAFDFSWRPPRCPFLSGQHSAANLSECRAYQYFISKYISARPSRCHRMKQKCSQISLTV